MSVRSRAYILADNSIKSYLALTGVFKLQRVYNEIGPTFLVIRQAWNGIIPYIALGTYVVVSIV